MKYTLLINKETLKRLSLIDDNVDEQYIRPAIITAQEISLQQTIGTSLYDAICDMVDDGSIENDENTNYKYQFPSSDNATEYNVLHHRLSVL